MADTWEIKFQGSKLLGASEGEYKFKRGLKPRRVIVEDVVGGVAVKDGCQGSAVHTLTLYFATKTTDAAAIEAAVYDRIQEMWNGETGTLEVPEFVNLTNCVITGVETTDQERVATAGSPATQEIVDGVGVGVTITFEQA